MFGAIYIGLSGLTAYSRGLQQVSDNVANLNSLGFKASNVSFSDLIGINGQGGLSHSGGQADPGNGVRINDPMRNFQPGELRQTDRDLDLAIDGNGFLVLLKGDKVFYTRTGSFEVDKDGFIVLAGTDYRLATLDKSGGAVALSIDTSRTKPPKPTTTIKFADNLSSTANNGFGLSNIKVFDANGGQHVWQVRFDKKTDGGANEWNVKVTDDKGKTLGPQVLRFIQGVVDSATNKLVFEDTDNRLSVTMDFTSGVTSFSSGEVSTLRSTSVDGFGLGTLTTVTVNADGELEVAYSNDQKDQLGPVAIADFRNPQALVQKSGGLFEDTGSTERQLLASSDVRVGLVVSHRLEASNVDLAKQFGDLILIQRGFQASSQIISVSNDMIQQLFGIRGQG